MLLPFKPSKHLAFKPTALALSLSLASLYPLASLAQQNQPAELETLTVNASFNAASLYELGEATSLITSEQITARSAQHLEGILSLAPNVNFASGSSRARFFQIRGVGEESQFIDPVNPSIGLMVDGIDMTGLGTGIALFDLEQVEVLRGPQGTRFGANALGGLINITSAQPSKTTEGYVQAKAGNYSTYGAAGAVSGSLSQNLQGRLAVQQFVSDGYMKNAYLGKKNTNDFDEGLLRGKLAWQPTANEEIDFTYFYAKARNGYDAFTLDNSRTSLADQPGKDNQTTHGLGLNVTSQLTNAVTLKALTSYSDTSSLYSYDEDWVNPVYGELWGKGFDAYQRDYQRASLDLRLLSAADGRIFANSTDWVVGVYHQHRQEKLARNYSWNEGKIYRNRLTVAASSFYSELTSHLSSSRRLVYGLRIENWHNKLTDNQSQLRDDAPNLRATTNEWLYGGKLGLEEDISLNHLGYLSFARGYKAGGINTNPDIAKDKRKFETETTYSTELGLKSNWLASALNTRLAVFYLTRNDQQAKSSYPIPNTANFQDYFANAAKGESWGLELEADWQPTDWLTWEVSYGFLRARFKDYSYHTGDGLVNKSGRDQLHSPRHSGATALTFSFTEQLALRLEAEAKSSFYFEAAQDAKSNSYALYHARLSYSQPNYELALSGRNLTDKEYATRGYSGFNNDSQKPTATDGRYIQLGEPRLFLAEAKYFF